MQAVDVPVTLKIRTGWDSEQPQRARPSRASPKHAGIQALAIHGRTRACAYTGEAEYDTIAAVKAAVQHSGDRQRRHHHAGKGQVRARHTPAPTRVMIGRAAQGRPWIFREIEHFLNTGEHLPRAAGGRDPRVLRRAPARSVRLLRRAHRRARGAQAHLLVHQGPGRLGAVPPCHEPAAEHVPSRSTGGRDDFFAEQLQSGRTYCNTRRSWQHE